MKKIIRFKFLLLVSAIFVVALSGCTAVPLTQATKEKIARLEWSPVSGRVSISGAFDYCYKLQYGGHKDWRLPTIDELRSIIKNCPGTELEGKCRVSEVNDNLSYHRDYTRRHCHACDGKNWRDHSTLVFDNNFVDDLISSSRVDEDNMVGFAYGSYYYGVDFTQYGSIILYPYWGAYVNAVCVREN